jgi:hypothetical protein
MAPIRSEPSARQSIQVDQHAGLRHPEIHRRHQALPPREEARRIPMRRLQRKGGLHRFRRMPLEGGRLHAIILMRGRCQNPARAGQRRIDRPRRCGSPGCLVLAQPEGVVVTCAAA